MSARKGGLGRGLGALIPTSEPVQLTKSVAGVEVEVANLKEVLISQISPNPRQPRTVFDEEALIEQTFLIDNDFDGEPWVVVENNTQELSLSLEN